MEPGLTLDEAVATARRLDTPELFDEPYATENLLAVHRSGCVSAVAAMVTKFTPELTKEALEWSRNVLRRAANHQLDGRFMVRESVVSFAPPAYAVIGLCGLVERKIDEECDRALLMLLSIYPLRAVSEAVHKSLGQLWDCSPLLCWQIFSLGTRTFTMPWDDLSYGRESLYYTDKEWAALERALDEIWGDYQQGVRSSLATVPSHWKLRDGMPVQSTRKEDWRRGDTAFLWHVAPTILFSLPLEKAMSDSAGRQEILALLVDLLSWTIDYINPPWSDARDYDGDKPYEWIREFMKWCGRLSGSMSVSDTWNIIINPIFSAPRYDSWVSTRVEVAS